MRQTPSPAELGKATGRAVRVPDPLIAPLRDADGLVERLVKITERPKDEVVERLRREEASLGRAVREELDRRGIQRYVWSDGLERFYEETDAFLYESIVWNLTRHKNRMRGWIAAFLLREFGRPATVLVYGDGLGFDSYYLALAGHQVSSFEVSRHGVEFSESVLAAGGIDVRIYRDAASLPEQHFDVLLCLDVLEHVPDPPALVQQMSRLLKRGGHMIVHAPFFFVDPAVSTHLRTNRRYSGDIRRVYRPSGLQLVDGRPFWDPVVLQKTGGQADASARHRWWPRLLRVSGLFLAVGRCWSLPHSLIARRLTHAREIYLTNEL